METQNAQPLSLTGFHLWQEAADFAAIAHRGQKCPGTKVPYFSHPARVASLVSTAFANTNAEIVATAYLHDVLEKTDTTSTDISRIFGPTVCDWVEWLSKNAKGPKRAYWDRLDQAPWQAKLVKLADALDHLYGPAEYSAARVRTAKKALALTYPLIPELVVARSALQRAILSATFDASVQQ